MKPAMNRQKLLLVVTVICLGLLVGDRLVFTPLLNLWRARQEEIAQLRSELAQASGLLDQESRWQEQKKTMTGRLLPGTAEAESLLLTRVDGWARSAGMQMSSLRPSWKSTKSGEQRLELQVVATGSMTAVIRFLHQVETAPLAIAVEQLEMTSGKGSELGLSLRLSGLCTVQGGKQP